MTGKELTKRAIDFSAGSVTAAAIKRQYGEGVFSTVAALAAGGLTGVAADAALEILDKHTGAVSAVGSVVDAGIGAVGELFDGLF